MRKRTDKEKAVLGKVELILIQLDLAKDTAGYVPLLDAIACGYAFPEKELTQIICELAKENYYLGLHMFGLDGVSNTEVALYSAMVHDIKTGIERANEEYLQNLQLDKLQIILKGKDEKVLEAELINEIGQKYVKYSNNEKIVLYFVRKILKVITYWT